MPQLGSGRHYVYFLVASLMLLGTKMNWLDFEAKKVTRSTSWL